MPQHNRDRSATRKEHDHKHRPPGSKIKKQFMTQCLNQILFMENKRLHYGQIIIHQTKILLRTVKFY